jgi:cell division septal protein FtsQ
MDKRVRARRRTVGRQRGHRRASMALIVLVVIACAALFLWLRASDVFAVKRITATPTQHVTREEVYQATAEARGVSLLRLSTAVIEAELTSLPYVRTVEIHRGFPDTLEVEIFEYTPTAGVRGPAGEVWLVADDGRVLEKAAATELPLIVMAADSLAPVPGEYLPASVADALLLANLAASWDASSAFPAMDHIAVSNGGDLTVVFQDGIQLRLGSPQELEQKLTVAETIIEQYLRDGRRLLYVDASVPDRVAVKAD